MNHLIRSYRIWSFLIGFKYPTDSGSDQVRGYPCPFAIISSLETAAHTRRRERPFPAWLFSSPPPSQRACLLSLSSSDLPFAIGEISEERGGRAMSKARAYADVNVVRPKEYWDYVSLTVHWGYDPDSPTPSGGCCYDALVWWVLLRTFARLDVYGFSVPSDLSFSTLFCWICVGESNVMSMNSTKGFREIEAGLKRKKWMIEYVVRLLKRNEGEAESSNFPGLAPMLMLDMFIPGFLADLHARAVWRC